MARSNKDRQAAYRKQRAFAGTDGNGERRLSTWIETSTHCTLDRLARHYETTRRDVVETLIENQERRLLKEFSEEEADKYFSVTV